MLPWGECQKNSLGGLEGKKKLWSMLVFQKASFLAINLSYYIVMTFLMMLSVILQSVLMILLSTLSVVELSSDLESDLQDTVDGERKCPVDFSARKTQLISFGWSNNYSATD